MERTRIRLASPVPEELASELEKRLFFVSSEIQQFELLEANGFVNSVEISLDSVGAADSVARKINRMVESEVLTQKVVDSKVLWRSRVQPERFTDAFSMLVREGMVFEAGEGQVAYGRPLIALEDYFDSQLRAMAMSLPHAEEYRYPTILPTSVLERFDYFSSFPQFVMFITRLHNDVDVYADFVKDYQHHGRIAPSLFERCRNHDYCLPPTMCYHTYHQFEGRRIDQPRVVTSKGKAFRFESKYHSGMERLWDFTIREMVFLGDVEFVKTCRASIMEQAYALMEKTQLSGTCEVANDPFFIGPEAAGKVFSQRLMEFKFELQLPIAAAKSIAVASFNMHGQHFGKAFRITSADQRPVTTGCVGFGLERLVYAFLCQHGIAAAKWPAAVRKAIE